MKNTTLDSMQNILDMCGIPWEPVNESYGFYREIKFKVYGREFLIEWYKNLSHIRVGTDPRSPVYPFRYLTLDDCFPLVGGSKSLCFAYNTEETLWGGLKQAYASFRIPLEI
jgi:hypothetical protein